MIFGLIQAWNARRRRHKAALEATKRLGSDEAAWSELFRRKDWTAPAAGHYGRCGQCGERVEPSLVRCPNCGAEWRPNRRRSDLYRQFAAYGVALAGSAGLGYGGSFWLRAHFAAVEAGGDFVNPEMVDTLSAFTWLFCSVMAMIVFTFAIERLAPVGHWRERKESSVEGAGRRERGA